MQKSWKPGAKDVLIGIDIQNDFCDGGALAVPHGSSIVSLANRLIEKFPHIILTQDWHPKGHLLFASAHPDSEPFQQVTLSYGMQTLWPDHCVQGTKGAEFHPSLITEKVELVLRKGFHKEIDSYSAFQENDRKTQTGLAGYLRERGFMRLILCGLALDYCVGWSALDGKVAGFEIVVIEDACKAIDLENSLSKMHAAMQNSGISLIKADHIL